MAIHAVLFPESEAGLQDTDELARIEQLGQQLLQLAIHSVAAPQLQHLEAHNGERSSIDTVRQTRDDLEQLSRRLSMFERVRGLAEMLNMPPLPLPLVLQEPSSTVLLCLASLPQGANLVGPLLGSYSWLVVESAPVRLPIVAQLLNVASDKQEEYASLAASGLLIGWKDGREASVWQSAQNAQSLSLDQLTDFYRGIVESLQQTKPDGAEAKALLEVLAKEWHGEEAQRALHQLRSTTPSDTGDTEQTNSTGAQQRFDLNSAKTLASQVSAAGSSHEARRELAKQLLSGQNLESVSKRVVRLVDAYDSAAVRSFALAVVAEARDDIKKAHLAAAVLYARPPAGAFRLDLNTPKSLLDAADAVLAQLTTVTPTPSVDGTKLGEALRSVLTLDQQSVVPAGQLLALLSIGSKDDAQRCLSDVALHLRWLREVTALVEGQTDKPARIDLCWLAAFGGDHHPENGREEAEKQQTAALDALLASFDAAHPPPSSLGGRPDRPGSTDAALLRFRAAWDAFFHRALDLCTRNAPLSLVSPQHTLRLLLSQVLRTGDVDLFRSLTSTSSGSTAGALSSTEVEELVLGVSTALFDQATVASTRSKDVRLSLDILSALPAASVRAQAQRGFIEAACRLSSFKIKSVRTPAQLMEPREIRATPDKMELIARLLATQEGAHRSPELVLDLAQRLCGLTGGKEKGLVEARTLAMLADAAIAAEDFDDAAAFAQRLVEKTARTKSSAAESGQVGELGWKTCFQLSKHPLWEDTPARITMLAHAMTLCPPTQLGGMLRQWHQLDQQLKDELEGGKTFASTKKAAAAAGAGAGTTGWMGDMISAQTAATMGAGLVGSAANLLPLSFSPLSYFGSTPNTSTTSSNTTGLGGGGGGQRQSAKPAEVDARTAKLFDFDAVSGASAGGAGGAYVDPAERAVRAARAARDFLGWKGERSSQEHGTEQGGGGALGGFSFSRGVGWLIGEDKR